jgi:hypothetical protein
MPGIFPYHERLSSGSLSLWRGSYRRRSFSKAPSLLIVLLPQLLVKQLLISAKILLHLGHALIAQHFLQMAR